MMVKIQIIQKYQKTIKVTLIKCEITDGRLQEGDFVPWFWKKVSVSFKIQKQIVILSRGIDGDEQRHEGRRTETDK